jgi:hypothetical protein
MKLSHFNEKHVSINEMYHIIFLYCTNTRIQSEVAFPWVHCFFPLVLTQLIYIIFLTALNTFFQEGYFLTNLEECDKREVL